MTGPDRRRSKRCSALLGTLLLAASGAAAQTAGSGTCATPAAAERQALRLLREHLFDPQLLPSDPVSLEAALAGVGVSHTARYEPDDPAYYELLSIFYGNETPEPVRRCASPSGGVYTGIGVQTDAADRHRFVRAVYSGGPADRAGLRAGDEIVSVDGEPFRPVSSFKGTAGRSVSLQVRRGVDRRRIAFHVEPVAIEAQSFLLQATRNSVRIIKGEHGRTGYIRMWSYTGQDYHDLLVDELSSGRLSKADGLVLDLRGRWGGANPDYANLFVGGAPTVVSRGRAETTVNLGRWRKPVVVLIDGSVRSGKELLAHAFGRAGIPLVGERTAGAVSPGRPFVLDDGSLLMVAVADNLVDGERLEGVGVAPTVPVAPLSRDAEGRDLHLEQALATIGRIMQAKRR